MEGKYTKDEIINFNETDWVFRRSSGYAGYDHVSNIENFVDCESTRYDESKWIYESEFSERRQLKSQYKKEYELISSFRNECLTFGEYPDCVIQNFLDAKFFKK